MMGRNSVLEKLRARARNAIGKPAPYGMDVDFKRFLEYRPRRLLSVFGEKGRVARVGIDLSASTRSGYFYQTDSRVELYRSLVPGVEIMPTGQAVEEKWDEIEDFFWRIVPVDTDKYTALTFLKGVHGYYVRVKKNTRVRLPIQACLLMSGGAQLIHNIIVLEEGAEATLITGCAIAPEVLGLHVGVSEFYVERGAKLVFAMIHSWNQVTHVRPRSAALLGDEAVYASYYLNMSRTRSVQTIPRIIARGKRSRAYAASIILGQGDSVYDIGTYAILSGEESSSELVSRFVVKDRARAVSRLRIDGVASKVRGYTECRGLLLSDGSSVEAIPHLMGSNPDSDLFHEASIGKLREDEVEYLMLKGFRYEEAVSMLVRGFVDVELKYPTPEVERSLTTMLDALAKRSV